MKQKIYFQLAAMNIGGVEKSWLNLVDTIDREKYEIHLGLIKPHGGYMDYIPKDVTVHHVDCFDRYRSEINDPPQMVLRNYLRQGRIAAAMVLLLLYSIAKFTKNRLWFYRYITRDVPIESEEYDIAIAYAGPSQMIDYYVCKKIRAKRRFGWIHFDITKFGIDRGMTRSLYRNYEKIFVVSETAKARFDEVFPQFASKTEVRYNIVSAEQVRRMAEEGESFSEDFSGVRILTVGRISAEKGQLEAVKALKLLVDRGNNVKWYFVGDGNMRRPCEELAQDLGIAHRVVMLGTKTNPYGYMRDCNIYMQPSRHEGYCITLAEARSFDIPIVATNFTGAAEQLSSHTKSVVTAMSPEDMANGIERFLK